MASSTSFFGCRFRTKFAVLEDRREKEGCQLTTSQNTLHSALLCNADERRQTGISQQFLRVCERIPVKILTGLFAAGCIPGDEIH
jgi:hypothetical protein